ncbi:AscBF operon repressor [Raoultella ornithinolytica]|nr:AscBF operon repressor [Raoultella ornithinolytica]
MSARKTKDRVFQAVAESGYRPNLLARNLATKKSQTLGLVVTTPFITGSILASCCFTLRG